MNTLEEPHILSIRDIVCAPNSSLQNPIIKDELRIMLTELARLKKTYKVRIRRKRRHAQFRAS